MHGIEAKCPYCKKYVTLKEAGLWECSYCGGRFYYKEDGSILTEESLTNEGIELIARLYAKMCQSDGTVSAAEIDAVNNIARQILGLKGPQLEAFARAFNENKDSPDNFVIVIHDLYLFYKGVPKLLITIIQTLFLIAELDGDIHPKEREILYCAINMFSEVTKMGYEDFRGRGGNSSSQHHGPIDKCYAVLGCSLNSPDEEIRDAYKRLVKQYHPDRYISKGLPPDMMEYASNRFKELQDAYETIRQVRKF